MAWYGYFTYDGTEIINVERTDAYINAQNTSWFANDYNSEALAEILQETYNTPLTDTAPWTDPDRMESYDFWGVYPLSVAGLEDSTRESTVTEYTGNGGNPGRIRHATRHPVFSVVLAGASECAVEYGFNWLKSALLGRVCEPNATTRCGGADLSYFSCEPAVSTDPDLPPEVEEVYALLDGGKQPTAPTQTQVSDDFDRGDSTTLGNADTGQPWVYSTFGPGATPGFGIEDEQAKVTVPGLGSNYTFSTIDAGTADVVLEDLIGTVSADLFSGVVFRRDPTVSNSGFVADRDDIYVGPSFTSVVDFSETFQNGDRRRIYLDGSNIRVDRQAGGVGNWTTVATTTHSSYLTNTHHGLAGWSDESAPARWDNFRINFTHPDTVVVDGGAPDTVFTDTFDGGAPDTVFPIELSEPYPEPFVAPTPVPNPDPTGCLSTMIRKLRNVQINDGPEVTAKKYLSDGSVIWTVTFTAVAGDPFEYSPERVVVEGFLSEDGGDPFGEGVDGPFSAVGYEYLDVGCPPQVWEAINDPLCPALVAPPGPVDIPAGCFEARDEWWRRFVSIPEDFIPLWGSSVPIISLTAQYDDLRQVRVRLYTDPTGSGDPEADQCAYVADLMVTYVPQGYTLVIDGQRRAVYAVDPGGVARRADSLVFSSDGKPIIWPELTCGYGYLMTIDTTAATVVPSVSLSTVSKGT